MAFGLAHFFGLPFVERIVKPDFIKKYDYVLEHQGLLISFILFLIPGFPKDFLCYLLGLSHMHFWKFLLVVTTGRIFGTALLSYTGSMARNHQVIPLVVLLSLSALLLIIAFFYRKRWLQLLKKRHRLIQKFHRQSPVDMSQSKSGKTSKRHHSQRKEKRQ